jgi:hypothetical protein
MFKIFRTLILTLVFAVIPYSVCSAQEITNYNDIIENGKELDGKIVIIKGEAIKEAMKRGDYTWINISDGSNAMGIWIKSSDSEKISFYGDYKHKGDTVKVTGTFNRSCSEHGGDMDIHGGTLEIVLPGEETVRPLDTDKIKLSGILIIITAMLAVSYYIRQVVKHRN